MSAIAMWKRREMAGALSVVSSSIEGYGIENMSNSVVVEGNRRIRCALVVGMLALGASVLMQTYCWGGGLCAPSFSIGMGGMGFEVSVLCAPFLSIGMEFVTSVGLYVAFMLLRRRCRAVSIIGVAGILICTISFMIHTYIVLCDDSKNLCQWQYRLLQILSVAIDNRGFDFQNLFAILRWLYRLSNLLSAIGLFFLAGFLQGVKKSFVFGVSLLWVSCALFAGFHAFVGCYANELFWVFEILGLVSFFLILKTCKTSTSGEKKSRTTVFLEIFALSIVVIGVISCFYMLGNAAPRSSLYDKTIPWNQGMVVNAILTFIKDVIVALIVLLVAKSDKVSADIECPNRLVVIRVVQALLALGAVIFVGVFIWAVMASDWKFERAVAHGILSEGSLSDFLTLCRIAEGGANLRTLVTIMSGVGIWYMVGFCFVWGALERIFGRVLGASAMKKSYEQQIQALKNPELKSAEVTP